MTDCLGSRVGLPFRKINEEINPSFHHFDSGDLPVIEDGGIWARIIAGSAFGRESPVGMLSEWLYAEVMLEPPRAHRSMPIMRSGPFM
jgi:redox-sensitive bicupin YhaK (pirin superfamily)